MDLDIIGNLAQETNSKTVLLVLDGLGGIPRVLGGPTELEAAQTLNMDELIARSICGLHVPVAQGITPGSGPAHLALFGYDPVKYQVGRGVLSALGMGFNLQDQDVAARGNFCTLNAEGKVTDRRAGRISTEKNQELCQLLRTIEIPGIELFVETVKEHRFLLVLRGDGLSGDIRDTDPQETGRKPLTPQPRSTDAEKTAKDVAHFLEQARQKLADHEPANMALLRGFSKRPRWPDFRSVYGVRAGAIAAYPMYRGVARLVGMEVLETGGAIEDLFATLEAEWDHFDFFYLHVKPTDAAGEDGDFDRKVAIIEQVDGLLPRLIKLAPDSVVITGDHSTPSALRSHSWHPVPVLLWSKHCRPDPVQQFHEQACLAGALGPAYPAPALMPLAMANAGRLQKFGA